MDIGAPHSSRMINLVDSDLPKKNLISRFKSSYHLDTFPIPLKTSQSSEPEHIQPSMILEAPKMEDDFYLNLLDWSSVTNRIAVGLGKDLFCWDEETGSNERIYSLPTPDIVASVAWQPRGSKIAAGSKNGRLELVDVERSAVMQKFKAHCNTRTGIHAYSIQCYYILCRNDSLESFE